MISITKTTILESGHCTACDRYTAIDSFRTVYDVVFGPNSHHFCSTTLRLCDKCLRELENQIKLLKG